MLILTYCRFYSRTFQVLSRTSSIFQVLSRALNFFFKFKHFLGFLKHTMNSVLNKSTNHWLKAPQRIAYKLAVLAYKCLHGTAPSYLADELLQSADSETRTPLRSASTSSLSVRRTRLSTVGDRAFRSTPLVPGTISHAMSRPHHLCQFSVVA